MIAHRVARLARLLCPAGASRHGVCAGGRLLRRQYSVARSPSSRLASTNAQLEDIVSKISKLTLLETSELIVLLKERLHISDVAVSMVAAAPAPSTAAPAAPVEEEKPIEQTQFKITLEKFDATSKAKVIKEIKAIIPGINLIEAKKFVESAPKVIKENMTKEDAEKIKKVLETAGATVTMD